MKSLFLPLRRCSSESHPSNFAAILRYLDEYQLGYVKSSIAKRIRSKGEFREVNMQKKQLFRPLTLTPFDKKGKVVAALTTWGQEQQIEFHKSPQVAIIGRSNVGKSSLLNALLGFNSTYVQKARVSDRPGETSLLSLYSLSLGKSHKLPLPGSESQPPVPMLVADMPGYGFSYMSTEEQHRCRQLVLDYLCADVKMKERAVMKRVLLLVDARHGIKEADRRFLLDLDQALQQEGGVLPSSWKVQLVYTKCDIVSRKEIVELMVRDQENLRKGLSKPLFKHVLPALAVSSLKRSGISYLQQNITEQVIALTSPSPSYTTDRAVIGKANGHVAVHSLESFLAASRAVRTSP